MLIKRHLNEQKLLMGEVASFPSPLHSVESLGMRLGGGGSLLEGDMLASTYGTPHYRIIYLTFHLAINR